MLLKLQRLYNLPLNTRKYSPLLFDLTYFVRTLEAIIIRSLHKLLFCVNVQERAMSSETFSLIFYDVRDGIEIRSR